MSRRKIYLVSSWRNTQQPALVALLRKDGHEVYDFRNPGSAQHGFAWQEVDPDWRNWTPDSYVETLTSHPRTAEGFCFDKEALDWCDTCVLLLPCGRSAHLEAGYAAGQRKSTFVLLSAEGFEPELMYLLCDRIVTSVDMLRACLTVDVNAPSPTEFFTADMLKSGNCSVCGERQFDTPFGVSCPNGHGGADSR